MPTFIRRPTAARGARGSLAGPERLSAALRAAGLGAWLCCATVGHAAAATPIDKAVETIVRRAQADFRVPGLSVVVLRGEQVVFARGFGHADLATKTPARADTVMFALLASGGTSRNPASEGTDGN